MNTAGVPHKGHYPSREIASSRTRFSGKRLETVRSRKMSVKKHYH